FGSHPQSPVPAERRAGFGGVEYFPYDPALRALAEVGPAEAEPVEIGGSAGSTVLFRRFGSARFELDGRAHELELYWLEGKGRGAGDRLPPGRMECEDEQVELEPVERVRVTILMDNVTDPLLPDQGPATRLSWPKALADGAPRRAARFAPEGVPDALVAEPGFTALVRVEKDGR